MKKKLILTACLAATMLVATGCGYESNMVLNLDLTSSQTHTIYFNESEIGEMMDFSGYTEEDITDEMNISTINRKLYYSQKKVDEKLSEQATKTNFIELNNKYAVIEAGRAAEETKASLAEMGVEFMTYKITMPKPVIKTNCTLEKDGKTVTIKLKDLKSNANLYAIYDEEAANATKITYSGVTKDKIYKVKKYITINTANAIKNVSITRNGKVYKDTETYSVDGKAYDNLYKRFAFVKDGKYVVKTTLANDATDTLKFTVDRTKPTTNVKAKTYKISKSKKITFKDATSGVKKATLNGKTVKSGKLITKAGKYTLIITDKAGNQKTVKFTIKKS